MRIRVIYKCGRDELSRINLIQPMVTIITRTALYRRWRLKGKLEVAIKEASRELDELRLYYQQRPVDKIKVSIMKYHRRIHRLYGRYIDLY